ncbi:MAG: glycosyltransferase family A protein [Patescibacteria group bacterium]|jgi:glycosyltransferase involved in cell wall biosynthesis
MEPLISVIIPTYQHAGSLPGCIDSVLDQTYKEIEIIVVDDGSTDETLKVLEKYAGKIKVVRQENKGSNPARNRGFAESRGEYVIFCDADIVMENEMLEKMHKSLIQNPQASYAYSGFTFGWKTFWGTPFSDEKIRKMNFAHTTSLIRRADFPGFDEQIKRLQDWDVWLTMLERGHRGILVPGVLFHVRIDGVSRIGSAWLPKLAYRIPWQYSPWQPKSIKKYTEAREIIARKHGL